MNLVVLDFESFYDKTYSLSRLTTESYIRDPRFEVILVSVKRNDEPTQWFTGPHAEIRSWLQQWDIPSSYLLCHNTAFDGAILAWHFGIKAKYYLDTLSMAKPIAGNSSASLAALSKRFLLGEKGTEVVSALGKRREDFSADEMLSYGRYCANDVDLTATLYQVLRQFTTPRELYVIDLLLRMFIDPVIELDRSVLEDHLVHVRRKKQELMDRIDQTIGRDQLMSNPKLALLLEQLGVEPPLKPSPTAKNADGSPKITFAFGKTDVAFKALLEHPDPRVQTVVAARLGIKSTLEETRTEAFLGIEERGPLPIMLNYYGAHTGRASGADKINLQNLPQDGSLRRSMRAPAGHVLGAGDSSQIEARMTAYLAGQWDLVEAFRIGADVYSAFATDIFDKPISNIPECKKERFVGKTCLTGDSVVVTNRGLVHLKDVRITDLLWDGVEWVSHHGLVFQGRKSVESHHGLSATSDHEILTERGWVAWSAVCKDPLLLQSALSSATLPSSAINAIPARPASHGVISRHAAAPADGQDPSTATASANSKQNSPVFDLANAGPRHRFTVITGLGPVIVHNCILGLGFGTGKDKLKTTLKVGKISVDITIEEAERIVRLYRSKYPEIVKLWRSAGEALWAMSRGLEYELGIGIRLKCSWEGVHLPNGMLIRYPNLRRSSDGFVYDSRKGPTKIYGAKLIENVVQALARIVVFDQMCVIDQQLRMYDTPSARHKVVLTVHDEVVVCVPEARIDWARRLMSSAMKTPPKWATDIPINCEVGFGENYASCK